MARKIDPKRVRRARGKTAHFTAKAKQKAYEKRRRTWRLLHPEVAASAWTPPAGHPRWAEFNEEAGG
jgi:hypothetical protein